MENNWSQYFNEEETKVEDLNTDTSLVEEQETNIFEDEDYTETDFIDTSTPQDTRTELSSRDYKMFCDRMSGELVSGETKAVLNYQAYQVMPEDENYTDPQQETIYSISRAITTVSFDELNPGVVMVSVAFKDFNDPELRLLWARIQKWRNSMSRPSEGVPLFVLHMLERASLGDTNEDHYTILECNAINPLIAYITREVPTMEAIDIINDRDEHMGGNVIKFLFSSDYVTFTLRDDIDTLGIKTDVEIEAENERYNNAEYGFIEDNEE